MINLKNVFFEFKKEGFVFVFIKSKNINLFVLQKLFSKVKAFSKMVINKL